jgi:tyrosyl-tRNA synthetase
MGKSAKGAVWLNGDLFSPYDFWQYWRNTEDADVGRFLKIFTRLPLDEIARLEALGGSEINEAKKVLATEATAIVHGREAAEQAAETARQALKKARWRRTCRPSTCRPPNSPPASAFWRCSFAQAWRLPTVKPAARSRRRFAHQRSGRERRSHGGDRQPLDRRWRSKIVLRQEKACACKASLIWAKSLPSNDWERHA